MKQVVFILLTFAFVQQLAGQNDLFKGNNLLIPQNLVVRYSVLFDDCLHKVNDSCTDKFNNFELENQTVKDMVPVIMNNFISGKTTAYTIRGGSDVYSIGYKMKPMDGADIKNFIVFCVKKELCILNILQSTI